MIDIFVYNCGKMKVEGEEGIRRSILIFFGFFSIISCYQIWQVSSYNNELIKTKCIIEANMIRYGNDIFSPFYSVNLCVRQRLAVDDMCRWISFVKFGDEIRAKQELEKSKYKVGNIIECYRTPDIVEKGDFTLYLVLFIFSSMIFLTSLLCCHDNNQEVQKKSEN